MKYAAFDLETATSVPDTFSRAGHYTPLGIACAAIALSDSATPLLWQAAPRLNQEECRALVGKLQELASTGYRIVTWNGCAFDWRVLAQESGWRDECGELALSHTDLMLLVSFAKGYYLALDKALEGAGLAGKAKRVTLKNGAVVTDMSGVKAPALWAAGEYAAVLDYLQQDALQLLELCRHLERAHAIKWKSNRGNVQSVAMREFKTVCECFSIPKPDVSWMSNPILREDFVNWIPRWQERIPGGK